MKPEEIIEKLRPFFEQEGGLEIDFLGLDQGVVNIRARRVAPGAPVAFVVKAMAGTFRRYLPEFQDVCLVEYDPGEGIGTKPSPTLAPVFAHRPAGTAIAVKGVPVADLSGLTRRDAVRAIEGFFKIWSSRAPLLGLQGLQEDAPRRAAAKWAEVYRQDYRELLEINPDRWEILAANGSPDAIAEFRSQGDEIMPGRIFLTSEEQP